MKKKWMISGLVLFITTAVFSTPSPDEAIGFRPEKMHPAYMPVSASNWPFFSGYLLLVLLMAAALIQLVRVKEIQRKETDKI